VGGAAVGGAVVGGAVEGAAVGAAVVGVAVGEVTAVVGGVVVVAGGSDDGVAGPAATSSLDERPRANAPTASSATATTAAR
jgi:hypothetical protein